MIRTLELHESLDTIWHELAWTEARLAADPVTADLAPAVREAMERVPHLEADVRKAWHDEANASAAVDLADAVLDRLVEGFSSRLLAMCKGNARHPRYRSWFSQSAPKIVRLGLASQLDVVRDWPDRLMNELEPELMDGGDQFADAVTRGDAAIAQRTVAAMRAAATRVRQSIPFLEDCNALRAGIHEELTLIAQRAERPPSWPDSFFQAARTPRMP